MGLDSTGTGVDPAPIHGEQGSVAAEHGLLLTLVALAIVAAATLFGSQVVRLIQAGADAF